MQNGYLYYAVCELAKRGVKKVDTYNVFNVLNAKAATEKFAETLTTAAIDELIEYSTALCRNSKEEYRLLVDVVLDRAFRRDTYQRLLACEQLCLNSECEDVQGTIYREVENLICEYQSIDDVLPMAERIDEIWNQIRQGQNADNFIDFKFPTLNKYCRISRTDAIIFAAREKRGKSMMLLNEMVDLLRKGKKVLYIDTELDTPLFTMRLISHLTGIDFSRIRDGIYTEEEDIEIQKQIAWIKQQNFTHKYMPIIDDDKLVSLVKQYKYKYGLDCVILDYLKGNGEFSMDAYKNSASLGKTTDTLKNIIAGDMKLFVLSAVQATATGAIADSAKIIRNCSALIYLERKSQDEIDADGGESFGNMKLNVRANRNGMIMGDEEYISLHFDGNKCLFEESEQPEPKEKRAPF
jgi:replicative DNA helicase